MYYDPAEAITRTPRPIELHFFNTSTTAVAGKGLGINKLHFQQESEGMGVPIGDGRFYTNITLRGCTNGDARSCDGANVDFAVSSRSGITYGRCNGCSYMYDAGTGVAAIKGEAEFTDGTWAFRDIKAKGLRFEQVGLFNGTSVLTAIVGKAWY